MADFPNKSTKPNSILREFVLCIFGNKKTQVSSDQLRAGPWPHCAGKFVCLCAEPPCESKPLLCRALHTHNRHATLTLAPLAQQAGILCAKTE